MKQEEAFGWGEAVITCSYHHVTGSPETHDHTYPPSEHPINVPDQSMLGGFALGMQMEGAPDQSMMGGGQESLP